MTADGIVKLLATRHAKDVFVPECKVGPSASCGCPRMDAWTMNRSWANHTCTAYEVKVSRSDFLGDDKWPQYLPYCHRFFFVCPPHIIERDECPAEAGLVWTSTHGKRLYTKKMAPRRDVEIPAELWIYLLMCRMKLDNLPYGRGPDYWQQWLAGKHSNRKLGHTVSQRIRKEIESRVLAVEQKNTELAREIEDLERVRDFCRRTGIDIHNWRYWSTDTIAASLRDLVDGGLANEVRAVHQQLGKLYGRLEKLRLEAVPGDVV